MEILSIKRFHVGELACHSCGTKVNLLLLIRVESSDGSVVYVCSTCCKTLAKICNVTIEDVINPDLTECAKCVIRFKCFTNRDKEEEE